MQSKTLAPKQHILVLFTYLLNYRAAAGVGRPILHSEPPARPALLPLSYPALKVTPELILQAKKHASRFRALVLIGVAATFYAAAIPHITKLAEAEPPVACPPQWLPVLLASLEYPTSPIEALEPPVSCNNSPFVLNDDIVWHSGSAVMIPATVSFNGKPKGWPIGGISGPHECDEMASVGPDGTVRGKSHLINAGFDLYIIGTDGEMIEFRYYSAAENTIYYSDFRYQMKNGDHIGKFGSDTEWYHSPFRGTGPFDLPLTLNATWTPLIANCVEEPSCGAGCNKVQLFFGGQVFRMDVGGTGSTGCVVRGTTCVEPSTVDKGYEFPSGEDSICVRGVDPAFAEDYLVPCYTPCVDAPPPTPPPTPPPPTPPPPSSSPAPPPCKSSEDVETCKDDCGVAFKRCKDEDEDTKKACKKKKKKCKKKCDAATLCPPPPACEDNVPIGITLSWCTSNAKDAAFCSGAQGKKKCKKSCKLCI